MHAQACAYCGGPVETLDRYCAACGGEQAAAAEVHEPETPQKHFRCDNCGAEVAVDLDQRSYVCAFCDSSYVVEFTPEEADRQPPEFVVGFAVTPEEAMEKFRHWLGQNTWFRPGDLKAARIEERLGGVYLPFWSFSVLAQSNWSATIGEYWYKTETYTDHAERQAGHQDPAGPKDRVVASSRQATIATTAATSSPAAGAFRSRRPSGSSPSTWPP